MLQTDDYVILVRGVDDVPSGQLCRVLAPDETAAFHRYSASDWIPILSWTGYVVWSAQDNLIEVSGDNARLEQLFQYGFSNISSNFGQQLRQT